MPRDRDAYFDRWSALHGSHDPRSSMLTRWWLSGAFAIAQRCSGVSPLLVTLAGLVGAVGAVLLAAVGWLLPAAGLVLISGFLDSLDGAVAIVSGRDSRLGYVLDSLADRISDSAYVAALWVLGAPGWLCVVGAGLSWLQEYARARAGAAGMTDVAVVTIWERPTRIALTGFLLVGAAILGGQIDQVVTAGAAAWVGLGAVGMAQTLLALRRKLAP